MELNQQKKGQNIYNDHDKNSEQNVSQESIAVSSSEENDIIISEDDEFSSPSASYGSPIIKDDSTTSTQDAVEAVSVPKNENEGTSQHLNNNEYNELEENINIQEKEAEEEILEGEMLQDPFKGGEEFYSLKEDIPEEDLEEETPELYLDVDTKGETQELDDDNTLNAEANGQEEQDIDEDLDKKQKPAQNQDKDKKKEVTVPWGLGATLGLEAVAPVLLGGVLGPAAILMAILWLSHKSFKLPVTEKAKKFKDKHYRKEKTNSVNDKQNEEEFNMGQKDEEELNLDTTSNEEFNVGTAAHNEEPELILDEEPEMSDKTLIDLFIENQETFEKAFEDLKTVEGIDNIPNYKELIEIIDDMKAIINDDNKTKEEKEDKVKEFFEIGNKFIDNLEKNEAILNCLEQKFNEKGEFEKEGSEKEEPVKNNSLFSAFKIIKDAKKVDNEVRKHGVNTSIEKSTQGMSIR